MKRRHISDSETSTELHYSVVSDGPHRLFVSGDHLALRSLAFKPFHSGGETDVASWSLDFARPRIDRSWVTTIEVPSAYLDEERLAQQDLDAEVDAEVAEDRQGRRWVRGQG